MRLVPPTHGYAAWRYSRLEVDRRLEVEAIQGELLARLDRLYRKSFGAPVPRDWISYVVAPDEYRITAAAPTRARRAYVQELGEVRDFPAYVTTSSQIPLVASPYLDNPYNGVRLVFRGWDLDTGLMVFGR